MAGKIYYLFALLRPANIITAISDILAGVAISGILIHSGPDDPLLLHVLLLIISTSGLYGGGIVFNDIFDLESDTVSRPERILPRQLVSKKEAVILGIFMFAIGIISAFVVSMLSGFLALSICILALFYNKVSKYYFFAGSLNMGLCRGLNLLLGISIINSAVWSSGLIAVISTLFITGVTFISKKENRGNNKSVILSTFLLDFLLIFLYTFIGNVIGFKILNLLPLLFCWLGVNFIAKLSALHFNQPDYIKIAVKTGVLSLILLNASYIAGSTDLLHALPVLILLPLSVTLSKKFAVT
ncbi:UbiA-like protein EboC [Chryseobacterium culicis]|uniref:Polyprenyltransferase n=1 Tax=Chryseobacterium culicis TaxID=680127 RepID=A0A2S9CZ19_CHRCI|nr:UbiA-like protein EboC [Chryseobacterium culicis]PRB85762.1 polyprenyltransferase [Chryseobacterium culicis]PRB90514.1 polyprenyltransferase [Chryseobacterium culicis]